MVNTSTELPRPHAGHQFSTLDLDIRSDEELIAEFLSHRASESEHAFRTIVSRHGPMVLGVCRQIMGQAQDAEDSFQAVFLVLARKAATIRDRRLLASWLYEVAYRISVKARLNSSRRRNHESRYVNEMPEAFRPQEEFENNVAWSELRTVLQSEVDRLPEKYRTPVILCYLEGKTNAEAARILNWPIGSVKGRLSRARDILHSRLLRRNLVLSAAFLLSAIHRQTTFAEVVPLRLLNETVDAVQQQREQMATHASHAMRRRREFDSLSPRALGQASEYLNQMNRIRSGLFLAATVLLAASLGFLGITSGSGVTSALSSITGRVGTFFGAHRPSNDVNAFSAIRAAVIDDASISTGSCH